MTIDDLMAELLELVRELELAGATEAAGHAAQAMLELRRAQADLELRRPALRLVVVDRAEA